MSIAEKDDAELIVLYFKGNEIALEFLIKRHMVPLFRYANSYLKNEDESEEMVQKIIIKIWKHLDRFDETRALFTTWMYTVARNTIYDELRRKKTISFSNLTNDEEQTPFEETLTAEEKSIEEKLIDRESVKDFENIIKNLPPKKAEIVLLHLYQELTFQEISEITSMSINTVKSIYRRAIINIKDDLSAPKVVKATYKLI